MTTSTVMDIQYQIVLMNLAMLSCHPTSYPSHIDLADGVVQINDSLGFGTSGGLSTFGGDPFGIDQYGPAGERQITEQWGADATTDPERLTELQDLYRLALGLPPLPPPNAISYLRYIRRTQDSSGGGGGNGQGGDDSPSTTSAGGGGSTPSGGGGSSDDSNRRVPIEILLTDVPRPGWFHVGGKKDVPKVACYVGRYGDRYAWVTADGIPALARFTATVQAVVKFSRSGVSGGEKRGLAVTR